MTRFTLQACPRCRGAIIDYGHPPDESPMCIVCGWREQKVPRAVADEVSEHLGRPYVEHNYTHSSPFRGKPPLSGWEREKRRKLRSDTGTDDRRQLSAS
jgi:hypothetical protein